MSACGQNIGFSLKWLQVLDSVWLLWSRHWVLLLPNFSLACNTVRSSYQSSPCLLRIVEYQCQRTGSFWAFFPSSCFCFCPLMFTLYSLFSNSLLNTWMCSSSWTEKSYGTVLLFLCLHLSFSDPVAGSRKLELQKNLFSSLTLVSGQISHNTGMWDRVGWVTWAGGREPFALFELDLLD